MCELNGVLEGSESPRNAESAMAVSSKHGQRSVSGHWSSSRWNRPRWPDGRLVHPGDDRHYSIARLIILPLVVVQFWLVGRLELADVRIEANTGIVLAFLAVAAVTCEVVSTRRIWALTDGVADGSSGAVRAPTSRLCRAPRWPDGRVISRGEDKVALATRVIAVLLVLVFSLACGWAGVPNIYVDANLSFLPGLMAGPICLIVYWMSRRHNVIARQSRDSQ